MVSYGFLYGFRAHLVDFRIAGRSTPGDGAAVWFDPTPSIQGLSREARNLRVTSVFVG